MSRISATFAIGLVLLACTVCEAHVPRKLLQKVDCTKNSLLCKLPVGVNVFGTAGLATAVPTATGGTQANSLTRAVQRPFGLAPPVATVSQAQAGNSGTVPGLGLAANLGGGVAITNLAGETKVLSVNNALAATLGKTNTASAASLTGNRGAAQTAGGGPNLYVNTNIPVVGGTWGVGSQSGVALGPLTKLIPNKPATSG